MALEAVSSNLIIPPIWEVGIGGDVDKNRQLAAVFSITTNSRLPISNSCIGLSPSGKATDFDSVIPRFKS